MIPGVLTDLDTVDWAGLTHAYGSAEDIPGVLRAKAAGDPEAWSGRDTFVHQGTRFPATAPAVPLLLDSATGTRRSGGRQRSSPLVSGSPRWPGGRLKSCGSGRPT